MLFLVQPVSLPGLDSVHKGAAAGKSGDDSVVTIQSGMLIALGFLAATLLGLLAAPAFWSRAVRLTTRRIKDTMPLSELEIEADRDRIRAEYAIKMHKLETLVEQVKLAGARQQIEINRRDARVNMLEADLEQLRASYEEAQNARRVLEQTIADRLPRVEGRLTEARKVLHAREREIHELTGTVDKQVQALTDASSLAGQQQHEIEGLKAALSQRGSRRWPSGARSESEVALRSEFEALQAKTKEQAQLLVRLQSMAGRLPAMPQAAATESEVASGEPAGLPPRADLDQQLKALRARNEDQAAEIVRLKAAIAVFERAPDGETKPESRVALKARVESLEAQSTQQAETVAKLRGELAAANERLARQAAHYTGELRRLSAGPQPSRQARATAVRSSLADRAARSHAEVPSEKGADPSIGGGSLEREPRLVAAPGIELAKAGRGGAATSEERADEAKSEPADEHRDDAAQPRAERPRLLDRIAGLSRTP